MDIRSEYRRYFTFQLKVLQEKREEDRRRLDEQYRADLEAQIRQMQDMMIANMGKLRSQRQAMIDQNQTLQDTIRSMNETMERRNGQIAALIKQVADLALAKPPPPPPPKRGWCNIQ